MNRRCCFWKRLEKTLVSWKKLAADKEVADAIIGFHAQQAVEKMLKAVLTKKKIAFPWHHDLESLLDLLRKNAFNFLPRGNRSLI